MGIKTVMITGDNPLTAAAIAAEAGVDDFMAEATPEDKLKLIRTEQAGGRMVAMTGDGTNDAPALAQADVGVAMNTGTMAAKEAGNMVDLDSNPTKLIEIVEIGKQLLMTRGALTTFSIANDVAKYFAIIPAMFILAFPQLNALNIMRLATPQSAILSAVIFNAVIIIALIPLALRGISYKPLGAAAILRRNLLIYGVGGVLLPFVGIKAIDVLVTAVGPRSTRVCRRRSDAATFGKPRIIALLAVVAAVAQPRTSLERLLEARRLSSELLVQFSKAVDAGNRAVMAEHRGRVQRVFAVKPRRDAGGPERCRCVGADSDEPPLFGRSGPARGVRADDSLSIARWTRPSSGWPFENTNLKAQRLSFGSAQQSADAFRDALDAIKRSSPGEGLLARPGAGRHGCGRGTRNSGAAGAAHR